MNYFRPEEFWVMLMCEVKIYVYDIHLWWVSSWVNHSFRKEQNQDYEGEEKRSFWTNSCIIIKKTLMRVMWMTLFTPLFHLRRERLSPWSYDRVRVINENGSGKHRLSRVSIIFGWRIYVLDSFSCRIFARLIILSSDWFIHNRYIIRVQEICCKFTDFKPAKIVQDAFQGAVDKTESIEVVERRRFQGGHVFHRDIQANAYSAT